MKIKTILTFLTLAFVILIIIVGFIMSLAFGLINRELAHYNDVNRMNKDISELSIITHEYFMYHEKRMLEQWRLKYDSVAVVLEKMRKKEPHPERLPILESIASEHKILGDLFSQLRADLAPVLKERVVAHALTTAQKITSEVSKFSAVMQENIREVQQKASLIVLFSIAGFIVLSFSISFLVIRAITGPLNELVRSTEIIGKGDLKHRVKVRTKNEIGSLGIAFNQMTENLTKITASRDELNAANQQLQASEQQLRASNQQLRANEQQLRAEISERKKAEEETKKHLHDLEIFYKASRGREERILELKKRVKELEAKLGKKPNNEG